MPRRTPKAGKGAGFGPVVLGVESAVVRAGRQTAAGRLWSQADMVLLVLLAIPACYVDWRIASVWSWPPGARIVWFGLTAATVGAGMARPAWRAAASALTVASLYGLPVVGAIVRWHLFPGPVALIGDGALQTQLAGELLLGGRDPYGADYGPLGLASAPWHEAFPNPALHHTVFWPGQFLLPLPLQVVSERLLGWWDERVFLLLASVGIWLLLRRLFPGIPGRLAAIGFFLVPGHSLLAVLGDNDLPMVALLLGSLLAAERRGFLVMALLLGLAVATKQHGLVAAPFVLAWAAVRGAPARAIPGFGAIAASTALVVVLPFLIWDPGAFVKDTLLFVSAGGIDAYPINGFGLSSILLGAGIIHGPRDAFLFAPLEAAGAIAFWIVGWRWIGKHHNLGDVLIWSGGTLLVVLYVSRYFHDTHLLLGGELIMSGLLARRQLAS